MKNLRLLLNCLIILLIGSSFNFKHGQIIYKLEKPVVYKKGTFWKIENTQLMTYSGQKINNSVNISCYIDGEMEYKDKNVYSTTYLVHEENKIGCIYIDKENLKIIDGIGFWDNYRDTMSLEFEPLNYPLFKDKVWESNYKKQERVKQPIVSSVVRHRIVSIKDSIFYVNDQKIKTKSVEIETKMSREKQNYTSRYSYLIPNKKFQGSCPIFMWLEFNENVRKEGTKLKPRRRVTLTNFNW